MLFSKYYPSLASIIQIHFRVHSKWLQLFCMRLGISHSPKLVQRIVWAFWFHTKTIFKQEAFFTMSNLSEKELSALGDLLSYEELLVKKFNALAQSAQDQEVKTKMQTIAQRHQEHFNKLYSQL